MKPLRALVLGSGIAAAAYAQQAPPSPMGPSFCADLKAVTADAGNAFNSFKGAKISESPRDPQGYATVKYAASRSLAGAARCTVEDYLTPDGDPLRSYECEWTPIGSKTSTASALADATEECVGVGDPFDRIKTYANDWVEADIYTDDFEINIGAGTSPQVFFTIREP